MRRIEDSLQRRLQTRWMDHKLCSVHAREPFVEDAGKVPLMLLLSDKNGARMTGLCCLSPSKKGHRKRDQGTMYLQTQPVLLPYLRVHTKTLMSLSSRRYPSHAHALGRTRLHTANT